MLHEFTRTARKPSHCIEGHLIAPGTRYREQAISPGHDGITFLDLRDGVERERWMSWRRCEPCCNNFGIQLPAAGP